MRSIPALASNSKQLRCKEWDRAREESPAEAPAKRTPALLFA